MLFNGMKYLFHFNNDTSIFITIHSRHDIRILFWYTLHKILPVYLKFKILFLKRTQFKCSDVANVSLLLYENDVLFYLFIRIPALYGKFL